MSFNQFVQKLRDPEFLIKGCRIFWEKYEDNVSFAVQTLWQSFLKEESQRPDKYIILGGVEAVLLKWNQSLYKNNPQLMAKIEDDLEEAYNSSVSELEQLHSIQLGQPNFNGHLKNIGTVYGCYHLKSSIGKTGASKALHFIHPELFVAWDTLIRETYHENDPFHDKRHDVGGPECYMEFMKTCNVTATLILSKISLKELVRGHPSYIAYRHIRSLPKMLDECNWCWIFNKERW